MSEVVRARVWVRGIVQGVAFRAFTQQQAMVRELRGGVRNLEDGRVEALIQGRRPDVLALIEELKVGPPLARVQEVAVAWETPIESEPTFRIWH